MSQPSNSPPRGDQPAASPTPATPHRQVRRGASPEASPAPSQSPIFARTPPSGVSPTPHGSPAISPLGLQGSPATSGMRTPARRGGPFGSPAGSRAGGDAPGSQSSRRRVPASHRGWLGSTPKTPSDTGAAPMDFDEDAQPGADDAAEEGTFIYGTDINERRVVREFHKFMKQFKIEGVAAEMSHYLTQLHRLWEEQPIKAKGVKFPINGTHIAEFSPSLYEQLTSFPTEVIPIFDRELWHLSVREIKEEPEDLGTCQVKVHNLTEQDQKIMRSMNPCDIERLVSIKGIVIRCSDLVPDMMSALFRCTVDECKHEVTVQLNHWQIDEPVKCEGCGSSHSFEIVHNDCTFADRQLMKLQETPELVPEGETPQNVVICCFDDLVDQVRPGDRVEVTGIYQASPVRPLQNWKMCNSVYRTYIDAIAIASEQKGRIDQTSDDMDSGIVTADGGPPKLADKHDLDPETNNEEEIAWNQKVRDLGADKDGEGKATVVQKLVSSFAPSIFEEDEVKKGLLCQLFGGTNKEILNKGQKTRGKTRAQISQLLCGDPSTAKSQLIAFAHKLAPRGVYTSGKGSSAVGLTASISRDPVTKDLVLESGALVLSDRGLCCIDEFDKMDENARAILHEAMEQQTVSVAKSGIVCSLNARVSILAAANPKDSSYDPKLSVVDNISLPKNLMSRFDFIWLMLDKRNKDTDRRLGEHLVSMYSVSGVKKKAESPVDAELFRRYVSFAQRWVHPKLTDESSNALLKAYLEMRNMGSSRETITATPRILESLIRIAESLAKMELREEVMQIDVDEAVRLMKAATYAAAIDPTTGLIDMEQLIAGMGAGKRKRGKEVESLLGEVVADKASSNQLLTVDSLKAAMNESLGAKKEQLISDHEFNTALKAAETDGIIVRRGKNIEAR